MSGYRIKGEGEHEDVIRRSNGSRGFSASGLACGIKKNGAPDLALVFSELPARRPGFYRQ